MRRLGCNIEKELSDRIMALHYELLAIKSPTLRDFDEKVSEIHALRLRLSKLEGKVKK